MKTFCPPPSTFLLYPQLLYAACYTFLLFVRPDLQHPSSFSLSWRLENYFLLQFISWEDLACVVREAWLPGVKLYRGGRRLLQFT